MTRHIFANFTKFVVALAGLCLAFWPKAVRADAADVVTYNFTGTAVCITTTGCGSVAYGATTIITGTFDFDPDIETETPHTQVLMGSWSFNLPNISVSGSVAPWCEDQDCTLSGSGFSNTLGVDWIDFSGGYLGLDEAFLPFTDSASGTSFVFVNTGAPFYVHEFIPGSAASINDAFSLLTGTATPTPEPSSLLLLGTGLVGVGISFGRRLIRIALPIAWPRQINPGQRDGLNLQTSGRCGSGQRTDAL